VWASVAQDPAEVIEDAFREAQRIDPEHRLDWVALVDGNRDQLRLIQQAARRHRVKVTILLDVVHVLEYLWKAAYCFCAEASREAESWVTDRLRLLLTGHDPSQVAAGSTMSASSAVGVIKKSETAMKSTFERARCTSLALARVRTGLELIKKSILTG